MEHYRLSKILSTDGLDKEGIQVLIDFGFEVVEQHFSKHDLIKELVNFDAVIIRSATTIDADIIGAVTSNENSRLKVIARAGTGVDNIDVASATEHGMLVINTPSANTLSAAEHTFALMCSLSRQIPQAYMSMQQGKWDRKLFMGTKLFQKTLAIIGLGRIGKEMAIRAQAFGMKTIGFDPILSVDEAKTFNVEWMDLNSIWPLADYITVHVPLIPQTENLINLTTLNKCKKGVKIINCSRGGIVNETDLLTCLQSSQCGGAALDVFVNEPPTCVNLIKHPMLISTPHLGASTKEAQLRVSMEIANNLISLSKGESISGLIKGQCIELYSLKEINNWKILLQKLTSILSNLSDIRLFYTKSIQCCSTRSFENFIRNYLSMLLLLSSSNSKCSVNLINSHVVARNHNMNISVEKANRYNPCEVERLSVQIESHYMDFKTCNDKLYLTAFDQIELNQHLVLDSHGHLIITFDFETASEIVLASLTDKNLVNFSWQKENETCFIILVKEMPKKEIANVEICLKY